MAHFQVRRETVADMSDIVPSGLRAAGDVPAAAEDMLDQPYISRICMPAPRTSTPEAGPSNTPRKRARSDSDPPGLLGPPGKMSKPHINDSSVSTLLRAPAQRPSSASTFSTPERALQAHRTARGHDENYYFEDGSCVLLVDNVLFNVHRSILSRDSSSFGSMFSLPQGNNQSEGSSDEVPIMLSGDTAEEFRHFLWALYAFPPELRMATSNVNHLINIAKVSHKYSFKSLETWALDAIQDYVKREPSPILSPNPTESEPHSKAVGQQDTSQMLTRLIRLAQLCEHDRLLATMVALLRQLMSNSVQYAYLAMKLADELNLRTLRGAAYLEVMQKATVVRKAIGDDPGTVEGTVDTAGRLVITRTQQLKLLAGYYRLTTTWDRMRMTPLHFEHSHSCSATWHQQGCTQSWLEFWKEKTRSDPVMNLGLADVIGRLKLVQKDYDRWGSATYMHHDCRMNAKKAIGDMIKRVEESLPDYFSEPGDFAED